MRQDPWYTVYPNHSDILDSFERKSMSICTKCDNSYPHGLCDCDKLLGKGKTESDGWNTKQPTPESFHRCAINGCGAFVSQALTVCLSHGVRGEKNPASELLKNPQPPYYFGRFGLEVKDVIASFELGYNIGTAVAYLLRAGRKPGNPRKKDLQKAIDHITFEIADGRD